MTSSRPASCAIAAGDRVVMRRNDRKLGVVNGERGTVVGVDTERGELDVELRGRRVRLGREYVGGRGGARATRSPATPPRG